VGNPPPRRRPRRDEKYRGTGHSSAPVILGAVVPDPAIPSPAIPSPAIPSPAVPDPVIPDPVILDPVIPDPVILDPVILDPVIPDLVVLDPVILDPVIPDLVVLDPVILNLVVLDPVIPGLDPGISPSTGGATDPRVKPGDDGVGVGEPVPGEPGDDRLDDPGRANDGMGTARSPFADSRFPTSERRTITL
jgi:hypothetical protein